MTKLMTLTRLSLAIMAFFATFSGRAQNSMSTLDLNTAKPKYALHLTDATKIVNTKKDVGAISYRNGWLFVSFDGVSASETYLDIYDPDFNLRYSKQSPNQWSRIKNIDHDIIVWGDGGIVNIKDGRQVGQLKDYIAHSDMVDGVGIVKRRVTEYGETFYVYEFFTQTGESLSDSVLFVSRYSFDLQNPRPLVDGRRAVFIPENKRWYFVDEAGNLAFHSEYLDAHDFREGLAAVQKEVDGEYKWGFINVKGEEVIPFRFTKEPSDFYDDCAVVTKKNGKKTFLKKDGTTVNLEFDELYPRWEGHVVMGEMNPTYTHIMTPSKDVIIKDYQISRNGYVMDCSIPVFVGGWSSPVISFEGELFYRRNPGIYLADGLWWNNKISGYSAVVFNMEGDVLLAFKTVQDEF